MGRCDRVLAVVLVLIVALGVRLPPPPAPDRALLAEVLLLPLEASLLVADLVGTGQYGWPS